jgi:ankyrin repeat protein
MPDYYRRIPMVLLLGVILGCSEQVEEQRRDIHGFTPFHQAVRANNVEAVEEMLKSGMSPDTPDDEQVVALHRAARDGRIELVELLLKYKADTNVRTKTGWTPLHLAVQRERTDVLPILLQYNANPDIPNDQGLTAMHLAVQTGNTDVVREMLKEWTAWEVKRTEREDGTVELETVVLGTRTASCNVTNEQERTPLQLAIEAERYDMVAMMLDDAKKLDINAQDGEGDTVLHCVIRAAQNHLIAQLIGSGADLTLRNQDGLTPMGVARVSENIFAMELIWANGGRD